MARGSGQFLARIKRDRSGNTLALVAAAIFPLLAMMGGGVDMGRSYLSQSRLQQACDAGVLAARKRLGSEAVVSGHIPADAADVGNRFFNINFAEGAYGTTDRAFAMTLEDDYSISAIARVTVPTTIMQVFGYTEVPIEVECQAQITFTNTDVMMVLDVTGSMAQTNPGENASRIDVLRQTVKNFHSQLAAAAAAGTRIRYGFVPYSTNVNVGGLLKDEWVVDNWTYQSREVHVDPSSVTYITYHSAGSPVSGNKSDEIVDSYDASFDEADGFYCPTVPDDDVDIAATKIDSQQVAVAGPPAGFRTTTTYERTRNGVGYSAHLNGETCDVIRTTYSDFVDIYEEVTEPAYGGSMKWKYDALSFDVSDWRSTASGCVEERDTYQIDDYDNVDLSRALDLDIDRVPTPGDPSTQWRPMYPDIIFARTKTWDGKGKFDDKKKISSDEYVSPARLHTAACPPAARKLGAMSASELDVYLSGLTPAGNTYHDIGMIWGGRLLSPTGIFASENADAGDSAPTSRNLIFLTDGQTAGLDLSYSSYGMEPVDRRRWGPDSAYSLNETIEKRFSFACSEVRKKNITVWVIGYGSVLSDVMKNCAGEGHYFEAADAMELNLSFSTIAKRMSELRVIR